MADAVEINRGEHGNIARLLDAALKAFDRDYPEGLAALQAAAATYVAVQYAHIGPEKREVLPLARESFAPADRGEIDRAFAGNADPLFGANLEAGFRASFAHITR